MAYYDSGPMGALSQALVQGVSAYEQAKAMRQEKEQKQALVKAEEERKNKELAMREQQLQMSQQAAARAEEAYAYAKQQRPTAERAAAADLQYNEARAQSEKQKAELEAKYTAWGDVAQDVAITGNLAAANEKLSKVAPGLNITGVSVGPDGRKYAKFNQFNRQIDQDGNFTEQNIERMVPVSELKQMAMNPKEAAMFEQRVARDEDMRLRWRESLEVQREKIRSHLNQPQQQKLTVYDKRINDVTDYYAGQGYSIGDARKMAISHIAKLNDAPNVKDILKTLKDQRALAAADYSPEGEKKVIALDAQINEMAEYQRRRFKESKQGTPKRPVVQTQSQEQPVTSPATSRSLKPWEKRR